jgi:hypothetical protein
MVCLENRRGTVLSYIDPTIPANFSEILRETVLQTPVTVSRGLS